MGRTLNDTGVSDWLNTTEHIVYLMGYPNGSFAPDSSMTRAEAAQMFYNLLQDRNVPITVSFVDVSSDAWYAKAVNTLGSLGIIVGVGDNRYAPEQAITRAEFTTIATRFAKLETSGENIFSDVSSDDWYYNYVTGSIQYGWIGGYPDGTFRPGSSMTRAEVTTIVNRMLGRGADRAYMDEAVGRLRQFADLPRTHWAYYDIMEAVNLHDYVKTNNGEDWTKIH